MKVLPLPCTRVDLRVARMTKKWRPRLQLETKKLCPQLVFSCKIHRHSNKVHFLKKKTQAPVSLFSQNHFK